MSRLTATGLLRRRIFCITQLKTRWLPEFQKVFIGVFYWNLSVCRSPHVFRTLLCCIADLNNPVIGIVSILSLISMHSHQFPKAFLIFPRVLTTIEKKIIQNSLIIKLLSRLDSMSNRKEIIICWNLSHIGVRGNERTDSAAKSALDLTPDKSRFLYTDLKPTINKFLHTKWQQQWSNNIHKKLFQIQPTLGEWRPASRKSRREQVVISRLRIGHTWLTHSFILKQEPQP